MNVAVRYPSVAVAAALSVLGVSACATGSPDAALLPSQTYEMRALQIRRFDDVSEDTLLAACAGVLQDLGFNLDESETELGVVVASKERAAIEPLHIRAAQLLDLFLDIELTLDEEQQIRVSLVTQPSREAPRSHTVRVTFQRIVWNNEHDISKREALSEPELYQQFFDRLSKSVFLEAHKI